MSHRTLFMVTAVFSLSVAGQTDAGLTMAAGKASPSEAEFNEVPDKSLAADGVIERYILDPRGEVEGLLLRDGSHMYVTSRAADQLIRALKPGDHVQVSGRRKPKVGLIHPDVIKNLSNATTFVVPLRLDLPMQEQERRLSVTEMNAAGTIRRLLYHPLKDMVQGMILSDETQIRLPPDASADLRRSLRVGESVAIRGNGTTNQFGRAIEAVAIGRDSSSLVPLDASVRSLP